MVKGPADQIGSFLLVDLNEKEGKATIYDNTPFHRSFARGIITGGMKVVGDLMRVEVKNVKEKNFIISFEQAR